MARNIIVRVGALGGAAAILVAGGFTAPAQAATTVSPDRRPYCEPGTSYTPYKDGWYWYAFDSGTIKNSSKKATVHKSVSHSSTESRSTTKSAEVGLSIKAWVAEINTKFSLSVSKTVSYTTTTSFTVDVPPNSTVGYKDGIIVRKFKVKVVTLHDNCTTSTKWGSLRAADNYSHVWDK
jgi:hypothetical protein